VRNNRAPFSKGKDRIMSQPFADKSALVTGAGSGMGAATAIMLAKLGVRHRPSEAGCPISLKPGGGGRLRALMAHSEPVCAGSDIMEKAIPPAVSRE
jgi:hypothetical protein